MWVGGGTVWGAGLCCKGVHSEQCGATAWQPKVMGAAAIIQAAGTAEGIKAAGLERTEDSPGTGSGPSEISPPWKTIGLKTAIPLTP